MNYRNYMDAYSAGQYAGEVDILNNVWDDTTCMPPVEYAQNASSWHEGYDEAMREHLKNEYKLDLMKKTY